MKELSIANFKYGLDARREALTSLLGTLVTCENAHINSGGEVEKRKAFVSLGLVSEGTDDINIDFFMVNDVGYLFYADPTVPVVNPAFTFDVVLQKLNHPAVTEGAVYNEDYHKFLALKFAQVYNGKPFVAAVYSDENIFLFYDGELVNASRDGKVLFGLDNLSALATELAAQINRVTDWNAVANVDQNGVAQAGTVIVKSPLGTYFTPIASFDSALGFLGTNVVDVDNPGVVEQKATASFLLTRSADGTVELIAPANSDGTGTAALTGGAVSTAATDLLMATKVVQVLNDLTYLHGYTAATNGATISVYAPIGWGASINGFNLTVNVTGGMGTGGAGPTPVTLSATISPSPLSVSLFSSSNKAVWVSGVVTVSATGGTAPYTYVWSGFADVQLSSNVLRQIGIRASLFAGESTDSAGKCTVTDANNASVEVFLSVHLERQEIPGD